MAAVDRLHVAPLVVDGVTVALLKSVILTALLVVVAPVVEVTVTVVSITSQSCVHKRLPFTVN